MKHEHHHSMDHGIYKNEVERPSIPPFNHIAADQNIGMGMEDWKGQADPIALGQAGGPGCKEDLKRVHAQYKDYHWD